MSLGEDHMRMNFSVAALIVATALTTLLSPTTAQAGFIGEVKEGFSEGNWRLEATVATGTRSGRNSRTGDMLYLTTIEYEWPVYARATLGLTAYPLFVYDQSDEGDDTVAGGGIGLAGRYYFAGEDRSGWYGEVGVGVVGHSNKFDGNSGSFNFVTEAGIGYQFQNDWHLAVQIRHFSNGGFADRNSGTNAVGLGIGYSF